MQSKGFAVLFGIEAGDVDTNHARGYVVQPTAQKNSYTAASDDARDANLYGGFWGECASGPFVKDAR